MILILIDGYNVIAPVAPPGRHPGEGWLQSERHRLIERLANALGPELASVTTVVFDSASAPAGLPSRLVERGIQIEFAVGYPEADDRLEELIAAHSAPKRLTVISSDHRIQTAAKRRGATAIDSEKWLDRLADGVVELATRVDPEPHDAAEEDEKADAPIDVRKWLSEFGIPQNPPESEASENPFPPGYGEDLL
ncbi:MAG: NYN domain-containing protein [Planctomycetaceae bacterium]